jgi:predicted nucleic acid-binding protein
LLVLDANVVVRVCQASDGFAFFGDEELHAPALMWSEARSSIRDVLSRGLITEEQADIARRALDVCPVKSHSPIEVSEQAWGLSIEFGWARTYDAEYVALAKILACRLLTVDMRLHRGAKRLGFVITPDEL